MSDTVVVTGAAGFIGSNLVRALNRAGIAEVIAVDRLGDGRRVANLAHCQLLDYLKHDHLLAMLERRDSALEGARAVLHQGACTDTTCDDDRLMMGLNFDYSRALLGHCLERRLPLIYASSAAVYGTAPSSQEEPANEQPLNLYAFSKLMFDRWVRRHLAAPSQVVGLRYFNVYGPGEAHKGAMASMVLQLHRQALQGGPLRLFEGCDGYGRGEQRRDFVHVDDVVASILWFLDHDQVSGIFNVGTGASRSFNQLARTVLDRHPGCDLEYIPFPDALRGRYQSSTEADLVRLRGAGCGVVFRALEEGTADYLERLSAVPESVPGGNAR